MPLGTNHDIPTKPDSDDEDEDYVPPNAEGHTYKSDSETSEENNVVDTTAIIPEKTVDEETKKREREALWASFQASVASSAKSPISEKQPVKLVKIERKYRFAGEEVVEVAEVPEDSLDAKTWPRWKDPVPDGQNTFPDNAQLSNSSPSVTPVETQPSPEALFSSGTLEGSVLTATSSTIEQAVRAPPKRPGPRKPKTTLAAIPGPTKAKKLTTLDKSAMDWKKHLQEVGTSVADELEANRRGGGYLEKVEFLKRVEERKEENLDALKSNKRRKL